MADDVYEVFVSYNSRDREAVRTIAEALKAQKLRVWFDHWSLIPGKPWIKQIQDGLAKSASVAVFVGPNGVGPWENPEMDVALNHQVQRDIPIIPVLLPGMPDGAPTLPAFLSRFTAVDFRRRLDDPDQFARLQWGITGVHPLAAAPIPAPVPSPVLPISKDPLDGVIEEVAEAFNTGDVTFLLGRTVAGAGNAQMLAPCELSARLLRHLGLMNDGYEGFVPGVESVAALVAATSSEAALERHIGELLRLEINPRSDFHPALARVIKLLNQRPAGHRPRQRRPCLILTTNFDLLMERALMRAGLPFSRLIQYRAEPRIDVNHYDAVTLSADGNVLIAGHGVAADNSDALDDEIYRYGSRSVRVNAADTSPGAANPLASLPIDNLASPILYKFQGSQDTPNSIAISADQCFEFAWRLLKQDCVPSQVTEIVGNSTLIVLGSSVLDHDFRLAYHTLLRKPLEIKNYARFAVASRQDVDRRDYIHRMTEQKWDAIRDMALKNYGLKIIDCPTVDFLNRVAARLGQIWSPGK